MACRPARHATFATGSPARPRRAWKARASPSVRSVTRAASLSASLSQVPAYRCVVHMSRPRLWLWNLWLRRSYAHYCACGKALDLRLEELGGQRFSARVDVNREDWKAVDAWITSVCAGLPTLPLRSAQGTLLPTQSPSDSLLAQSAVLTLFDAPLGAGVSALPPKARQKRWSKARPYYARVMAVESLCRLQPLRTAEQKDTVRVDLDLGGSGLTYTPGDALGIYPLNCPQVASPLSRSFVQGMHLHLMTPSCVQAAEELLAALGARGDERVPVPSWHYEDAAPVDSRQDGRMPLREALLKCYDLRCVACI